MVVTTDTAPDLAGLDPSVVRRIMQTVACGDADDIPKVEGAGETFDRDGHRLQRMFNGLEIHEGCYYSDLITPIIKRLKGHHEPQEEKVVHAVLERLEAERAHGLLPAPFAIEPGAHWSFYSMWFCQTLHGARAVALEPDPVHRSGGQRNIDLNGLGGSIQLVEGVIGGNPGDVVPFKVESDQSVRELTVYDLASLMALGRSDHVDVVFCDIQGYETEFFRRAEPQLREGMVRFLIISTHHFSISGDPLTHQNLLSYLTGLGAHVIAEHSVSESCSGDGLIAVSFDARDHVFIVDVSHVRAKDSLFGELEYDLQSLRQQLEELTKDNITRLQDENLKVHHADQLAAANRELLYWRSVAIRSWGSAMAGRGSEYATLKKAVTVLKAKVPPRIKAPLRKVRNARQSLATRARR
jgi:FkbM family methyltransferase